MKKILLMLFSAALLFGGGCNDEYDDSALSGRVDELEGRVEKLEELCNRMNTNIVALRQLVDAFQDADYVTAIVPMVDGGVTIGYRISFAKSEPVIVYHGRDGQDGEDGKDGADGQDGYTPSIGVRQDTDGVYYWTLDGEWLTDAAGNKIQANATDGQDGADGQDGVSPKLKIEEGYWYISYDDGQTWTKLDKAAGEDGGDSIFTEVTQDDANVYFTLQDGTVITLPKSLTSIVEKINSIEFVPRYSDGKVAMVRTAGKSFAEFDFQISPRSVVAEIEKIWESAVTMQAVYTVTRAVDFVELPVVEFSADAETGVVTVKVSGDKLSAAFFAGEVEASAVLTVADSQDSTSSAYVPMIAEDKGGFAASYESWLGTWKVTSTSSEGGNDPVTFDVTFSQKAAGSTYSVRGWGVSAARTMSFDAYYDAETGSFYFKNAAKIVYDDEAPSGWYAHVGRFFDPADGKYYALLQEGLTTLIGALMSDTSAVVDGNTFHFQNDDTDYKWSASEYYFLGDDNKIYTVGWADGYTKNDIPVGPYTMTKTAEPSEGPSLEVALRAGDAKGENTDTNLYFTAVSPEAVAAKICYAPTSQIESLLGAYTVEDILEQAGTDLTELGSGAIAALNQGLGLTLSNRMPGTSYTVIFQATDAAGNSVVKTAEASTTGADGPLTLSVTVENITDEGADITVKPSNSTDTYYFDYYETADLAGMSDAQIIDAQIGVYDGAIPTNVLSSGVDGYDADYFEYNPLDANTEYTVIAFGYDAGTNQATTELVRKEFKTLPAGGAQTLAIDVKIDDTAAPIPGGVTATITPSDKSATYMFDFVLADEIEGMNDAQIISYVEEKYASMGVPMYYLITAGDYATMPTDFGGELAMIPGADYYLVAYGRDENAPTSDKVSKAKFTAGVHPDAASTTFSFKISDITYTEATVTVNPSVEPVTFMYDIFDDDDWKEIGGVTGIASHYLSLFSFYGQAGFTGAQIISVLGGWYKGTEYTFSKLTPGTHYNVVAIACDLNGNAVGTASVSEFTTESAGEPNEAYGAWIGTWSVTSASSWVSNAPSTFDISVAAKINNVSYEVTGIGLSAVSKEEVVEAVFDAETGALVLNSQQASFNGNTPEGSLPVWYCGICPNGDKLSFVRGDYPALTATGNGSSATMVGNNVTISGGVTLTVAVMDFAAFGTSGLYTFPAATGLTSGDYPIAPFSMTKKAATPAPAYAKAATMSSLLTSAHLGAAHKAETVAPKLENRNKLSATTVEVRKQQIESHRAVAVVAAKGSLKTKAVSAQSMKSMLKYSFDASDATISNQARSLLLLGREESFKKGPVAVR